MNDKFVEAVRADRDAVIVCHNAEERNRLIRERGLPSDQVVCPTVARTFILRGRRNAKLLVDSADLVLASLLGASVVAASFTWDAVTLADVTPAWPERSDEEHRPFLPPFTGEAGI